MSRARSTIAALAAVFSLPIASLAVTAPTPAHAEPVSSTSAAQADFPIRDSFKPYFHPAPDAAEYYPELNSLMRIFKLREIYFFAARDPFYSRKLNNPRRTRIYEQSRAELDIAKVRVALAIMKAEGNQAARALSLEKVGTDPAESKRARDVLSDGHWEAFVLAEEVLHIDPYGWAKYSRFALFREAWEYFKDAQENIGQGAADHDPYAVIDWGVESRFLKKARVANVMRPEDYRIRVVKATSPYSVDAQQVKTSAQANRRIIASLPGLDLNPYPSTTRK